MKTITIFSFFLSFILCFQNNLTAQGCSDAGFCTLSTIKDHEAETSLNTFNFGINYEKGAHSINNFGASLEYTRKLHKYFSIAGKLNAAYINGELGNTSGLSDFFISGNYTAHAGHFSNTNITIGFKIPLNNGNKKIDNMPVPMDYQTSLGTFDIIAGISQQMGRFGIGVAYQQSLNKSKNEFLPSRNSNPLSQKYFPSNEFERSGDILVRASYSLPLTHNITIRPSLLPIYHLADDKYTDADGIVRTISDSKGLTFNVNLFLNVEINNHNSFEISFGAPIVTKNNHPDGLKRSFVGSIVYGMNF
jgi:hypothetical protein